MAANPKTFLQYMDEAEDGGKSTLIQDGFVDVGSAQSISGTKTFAASKLIADSAILTSPVLIAPTGTVNVLPYAADGAIALTTHVALLNKAGVGAYTVAAPGTAGIRLTLINGSNNAHVITFTGTTLADGTTGLNLTVTMAAFIGSSITVVANTTTQWAVESQNVITSITP